MFPHYLLLLALAIGCSSSKPTSYRKEKKQEGYRDKTFEDLRVASFKANTHTKKSLAHTYAEFRAIEICRREKKHANIIDVFDKTVEKEITKSSGGVWGPSIYGGMYPYSRYSRIGFGMDYGTVSTNSWNETLTFPFLEVYYTCSDKILRPLLQMKELKADDIKHLVKDVKGALQVEKILTESPNSRTLEVGDILLKVNGKRVEKIYELIRFFNERSSVSVELLREGERVKTSVTAKDVTPEVIASEEKVIKKVCEDVKNKRAICPKK